MKEHPYASKKTLDNAVANKLKDNIIYDDELEEEGEPALEPVVHKLENDAEEGPLDYRYKPKNLFDDVATVEEYLNTPPINRDRAPAPDWKDAHHAFAEILETCSSKVDANTIKDIDSIVKRMNTTFSRMICLTFDKKHPGTMAIACNAAARYYLNILAAIGGSDDIRTYDQNGQPTTQARLYEEAFREGYNRIIFDLGLPDEEGKNKPLYNERIESIVAANKKYCMKPQRDSRLREEDNPFIESGSKLLKQRFWYEPWRMREYVVFDENGDIVGYTDDANTEHIFAKWDGKEMKLEPGERLPETYLSNTQRAVDPKRDL